MSQNNPDPLNPVAKFMFDVIRYRQSVSTMTAVAMDEEDSDESISNTIDHRTLTRSKRKKYDHVGAMACIYRDYLDPEGLFSDQFEVYFRISAGRFQNLMEKVGQKKINFYVSATTGQGPSMEARLLLPLKTLAYGVASHVFCDYFQMSHTMARTCCDKFDSVIEQVYLEDYLRKPTPVDLKNICKLHKHQHGVDGIFGSLDCTHTYWRQCPTAWQGSYCGQKGKPTIVMEALSDYNLFVWHFGYGYAGVRNDKTIFSMSSLLEGFLDGSFQKVEEQSGVIPFKIAGSDDINHTLVLVDGIYPNYSRLVHTVQEAATKKQKRYAKWQEKVRKDIERCFGVMKLKFQFLDKGIYLMDLDRVSRRVQTCVILHNICVSDRVMLANETSNYDAVYNPAQNYLDAEEEDNVELPDDLEEQQQQNTRNNSSGRDSMVIGSIGASNLPPEAQLMLIRRNRRYSELKDESESIRIRLAIDRHLCSRSNDNDS